MLRKLCVSNPAAQAPPTTAQPGQDALKTGLDSGAGAASNRNFFQSNKGGRGPVTNWRSALSLTMLNPESLRETRHAPRAVGSPVVDTGRYQHSACTKTEIFDKGNIIKVCANRSCPNKGANWALLEKLT